MSILWACVLLVFGGWICENVTSQAACPEKWTFNDDTGKCYRLFRYKLNWMEARQHCQLSFGDLAVITSEKINSFLYNKQCKRAGYWVGLNDRTEKGSYVWNDDQQEVTFFSWKHGQPNAEGDCGKVNKCETKNVWSMANCIDKRFFICESPRLDEKPVSPPKSCPDESWKMYEQASKCIKVINRKKRWQAAREACYGLGGDLVAIPDSATHDFIKGLMGKQRYWIGLHDDDLAGKWTWLNETTKTQYESWANKPRNLAGHESCVELIGKQNGKWNDKQCRVKRPFICQYSP